MPANPSWYPTPVGFVTPATPHTRISLAVTPGTLLFAAPAGEATPSMETASAATIRLTAARNFPRPVHIGVPPGSDGVLAHCKRRLGAASSRPPASDAVPPWAHGRHPGLLPRSPGRRGDHHRWADRASGRRRAPGGP